MPVVSSPSRGLIWLIGLLTWGLAGSPTLVDFFRSPSAAVCETDLYWLAAFGVFGAAFGAVQWAARHGRGLPWVRGLLGLQSVAALVMIHELPCYFSGGLVALVAWQAALELPENVARLAVLAQALATLVVMRLSGEVGWSSVAFMVALQLLAFLIAQVTRAEARTHRQLAEVNAELQATRELLVERGRADERSRISRELHDVLGHQLTALHLQLEAARREGAQGEALHNAQKMARALLQEVRDIARAVRQSSPVDVRQAIEALVEGIARPKIHVSWGGGLPPTDALQTHAIVRCAQEALTNTLRHADAENLWVQIRQAERGLELEVRDDGKGASRVDPGWGLSGMRERLEQVGGRLELETAPDQGFQVKAWVPVGSRA